MQENRLGIVKREVVGELKPFAVGNLIYKIYRECQQNSSRYQDFLLGMAVNEN